MRRIIILETVASAATGEVRVTGVFWFSIAAAAAKVPRPGMVSVAAGLSGAAVITVDEQAALESGDVREEPFTLSYSSSTSAANIKGDLVQRWNDRNAAIAAAPPTRQFFGVSWNGTAWSV